MVDAAAVGAFPEGFGNTFFCQVCGQNVHRPAGFPGQVQLGSIVQALPGMGTAVQAPLGGTLRRIFRGEMPQRTEAADFFAVLSREPQQNVDIVAALLQNHGAGLPGISPITPDEAVGLVPVGNVFDLGCHRHFTDRAIVNQALQGLVERRIAQHMAHSHMLSGLGRGSLNGDALFLPVAHGLFQQNMVALVQGRQCGANVVIVQGADKGHIRQFRLLQKRSPAFKAPLLG